MFGERLAAVGWSHFEFIATITGMNDDILIDLGTIFMHDKHKLFQLHDARELNIRMLVSSVHIFKIVHESDLN